MEIIDRIREFVECEAKSCSMEPGLITPVYIYRMWGGTVEYKDIVSSLESIKACL